MGEGTEGEGTAMVRESLQVSMLVWPKERESGIRISDTTWGRCLSRPSSSKRDQGVINFLVTLRDIGGRETEFFSRYRGGLFFGA